MKAGKPKLTAKREIQQIQQLYRVCIDRKEIKLPTGQRHGVVQRENRALGEFSTSESLDWLSNFRHPGDTVCQLAAAVSSIVTRLKLIEASRLLPTDKVFFG